MIVPFGKTGRKLKSWDLWGPLLLCIIFSWTLSLASKESISSSIFGTVFCVVWAGSALLAINAKLLEVEISFFHFICTLGYSLFPMNLAAFLTIIGQNKFSLVSVMIYSGIAFFWSCKSACLYIESLIETDNKCLVLFPVFLFYTFLYFFIVQLSLS